MPVLRRDQRPEQRQRQVVDRLVAGILERLERGRSCPRPTCRSPAPRAGAAGRRWPPAWPRLGDRALNAAHAASREQQRARAAAPPVGSWRGPRRRRGRARGAAARSPRSVAAAAAGRRSTASGATRSTSRPTVISATVRAARTMPTPRTSMRPGDRGAAAPRISRAPSRLRSMRSSATSAAPRSISRSARSDLPLPEAPTQQHAGAAQRDAAGMELDVRLAPLTVAGQGELKAHVLSTAVQHWNNWRRRPERIS